MSNSQIRIMIASLVDILQKNPYVLGLVLVGSQARRNVYMAGQYSDMEAYIVVNDEHILVFEKQLPEVVNKLGKVIFSYKNIWAGFSTVFDNLFRLELPLVKRSDLCLVFSRPMIQTVKILIDKTEGDLERALNSRPRTIDFQKLFQDRILDFWYMAVVAVQYYRKGEIWNARRALQILLSLLIKLMELLQDQDILLLEDNKRLEQFLSDEQINLLKKLAPAYNKKQIKYSLIQIIKIFPDISKKVADKYNYYYGKDIEEKIKQILIF